MTVPSRKLLALAGTVIAAVGVAACGSRGIEVARDDPMREGATLFRENCAGCHTLDAAGAEGSATGINDRERVDGPNFNQRKETVEQVLYAIRNGGFSGAIMPENIVTGEEAQKVAEFLAKYSGQDAASPPSPEPETDQ
jgi:mono/diheme cytochrome c family protein